MFGRFPGFSYLLENASTFLRAPGRLRGTSLASNGQGLAALPGETARCGIVRRDLGVSDRQCSKIARSDKGLGRSQSRLGKAANRQLIEVDEFHSLHRLGAARRVDKIEEVA